MSLKITKLLIIGFVGLLLIGCKFSMRSEIYISDVEALATSDTQMLFVNTQLKLEMPSEEECQNKAGEIIEMLSQYFEEVTNPQCVTEGFSGYLLLDVKIPMVKYKGEETDVPTKGFYRFYVTQEEGISYLLALLDREEFDRFNQRVKEKFFDSIAPEDLTIEFVVRNDSRKKIRVTGYSAYMNGTPIFDSGFVDLENRENLEILLSRIHTDYFYSQDDVIVASFGKPEEE